LASGASVSDCFCNHSYCLLRRDSAHHPLFYHNREQLTELAQAWKYEEIYAVFQDSDEVLLIAYDEVYHTDPALKPELEKALGRTLEEMSDDLDVPALVLLEIWWD
jgi:hypothetical protein